MDKFQSFMNQLIPTNSSLDFFVDFPKVKMNVNKIEIQLNQLNYLLGKNNLREAISKLYNENPNVFSSLNILIAVREKDQTVLTSNNNPLEISTYFNDPNKIYEYICETGLKDIFESNTVTNLVDYVFGIEVGLDTNARKNRSGKQMIERIKQIFYDFRVNYREEVNSKSLKGLEILGIDKKRFDFMIATNNRTYLIEANFYSASGSKLNEVARSYTELASKINSTKQYRFVWITDGIGWKSAQTQLHEAFNNIEHVYNLTTLQSFIKQL